VHGLRPQSASTVPGVSMETRAPYLESLEPGVATSAWCAHTYTHTQFGPVHTQKGQRPPWCGFQSEKGFQWLDPELDQLLLVYNFDPVAHEMNSSSSSCRSAISNQLVVVESSLANCSLVVVVFCSLKVQFTRENFFRSLLGNPFKLQIA